MHFDTGWSLAFCRLLLDNSLIPRSSTARLRSISKARAALPAVAPTHAHLCRIVRLLTDHATVVISGTKIADEIGTSRSEVWRLIQQLRASGVEIAGHPATGYRLQKVPDLLLPDSLSPLIKGTVFANRIHHFFRIGSTNVAAMEAAAAGAPEGAVFVAEEQTSGRGRGDHGWHSARSQGIYCSVILRPALAPADVLVLSLAAGLAVREAVAEVIASTNADGLEKPKPQFKPPHLDLRWPNDVLLNGKKFAGLLTELTAEATRVRYAVLGVGLNINQSSFPAELDGVATSLRIEAGHKFSRVELAAGLLKSLDREYRSLLSGGAQTRDAILRRFELHSSYARGRRVLVDENGGFEGTTAGLDARGFLLVETANGMRTVLSGGVRALD